VSTSLRDQLLKAGLISKKQADDAERKLEHQERQARRPPPHKHAAKPHAGKPAAARAGAPASGAPRTSGGSTTANSGSTPTSSAAAPPPSASTTAAGAGRPATPASVAQSAKLLRDQTLNRQQQEKAEKKAKIAAVRQMIEQNRLTTVESGDPYHFVDGTKIRQIPVDAALRSRLVGGELGIVRYYGRYDIVPTPLIARLRERDDQVLVIGGAESNRVADAEAQYPGFAVPDDLIW
jgi:uncharacterized protein YaiL (DUF2058 family)